MADSRTDRTDESGEGFVDPGALTTAQSAMDFREWHLR